jgi:hypothetical protein
MKKQLVIATRVLIVGILIAAIITSIVILGNKLYSQGKLPDHEVCERCAFGTFICWKTTQVDPCDVTDGRVVFVLMSIVLVTIVGGFVGWLIQDNTNFNFVDWIKYKKN